jgi:hypothetical protein
MSRPRTATAAKREKERGDEASYQYRQWRQWHRTLAAEALAGPHGVLVREAFEILRTMKDLRDVRLLEFVRAQDWAAVDENVRAILLHEIDRRVTALREAAGLLPFDDTLPHQRTNGFLLIRERMMEATPGAIPANTGEQNE